MEGDFNKEKQGKNDEVLVYEVSYILLPHINSGDVPAKADSLKNEIISLGGEIISGENPVLIELSYPMVKTVGATRNKVTSGYFGWLKFELKRGEEAGILKVKKMLDGNSDIVRFLLINTVRENTLLNGKMVLVNEEKEKKSPDEEVPYEGESTEVVEEKSTTEDIDKSIDDLVIV